MGANVWEWAIQPSDNWHQATMGGSRWYGQRQMRADYYTTKPEGMDVAYIGFRCISDLLEKSIGLNWIVAGARLCQFNAQVIYRVT